MSLHLETRVKATVTTYERVPATPQQPAAPCSDAPVKAPGWFRYADLFCKAFIVGFAVYLVAEVAGAILSGAVERLVQQ